MTAPGEAEVPGRTDQAGRIGLTMGLAAYTVWCLRTPDRYHFLDAVDLPIHETGHLVFAWGSDFIHALGGTLFQLIVPVAFTLYFCRRRDWHAASVPLWWVGQNLWNIARYVADARAQELPLVGGGEHDWAFLLAEMDRLAQDQRIAATVRAWGTLIAFGSLALGGWALSRRAQRGHADGAAVIASDSAVPR